jgi:hypothetical protein
VATARQALRRELVNQIGPEVKYTAELTAAPRSPGGRRFLLLSASFGCAAKTVAWSREDSG